MRQRGSQGKVRLDTSLPVSGSLPHPPPPAPQPHDERQSRSAGYTVHSEFWRKWHGTNVDALSIGWLNHQVDEPMVLVCAILRPKVQGMFTGVQIGHDKVPVCH